MLEIKEEVERGILFLKLDGKLTTKTFTTLVEEINYLLYQHGFQYFVFDFTNVRKIEEKVFQKIQSKLVEIFLNCGKVVMCGLSEINKIQIGFTKDRLFYVNYNNEAFRYLSL